MVQYITLVYGWNTHADNMLVKYALHHGVDLWILKHV